MSHHNRGWCEVLAVLGIVALLAVFVLGFVYLLTVPER